MIITLLEAMYHSSLLPIHWHPTRWQLTPVPTASNRGVLMITASHLTHLNLVGVTILAIQQPPGVECCVAAIIYTWSRWPRQEQEQ